MNDTCFGINNEGQLVFDYYHEDTDTLDGANVYNGQNSTLWCNFREAFADEIQETYQKLRGDGLITYDILEEQFITKGSDKWSESIFNEDGEFEYAFSITEKLNLAEGVETKEQYDGLLEMGCQMYQGYYFAKPMPVAEFVEKVAISSKNL